jgi:hypothetical protein
MTREKIILGGFETWVEYNQPHCYVALFGSDTAKHGVVLDVMGLDGHKQVNGFISKDAKLTEQEKKELNNYINNLHISN